MVSFARGHFFPSGNPSNDSSSISTTSSSLLFKAERRLETPYIDEVYHAIPLAVSHLEEEEEVDEAAIVFSSPPNVRSFSSAREDSCAGSRRGGRGRPVDPISFAKGRALIGVWIVGRWCLCHANYCESWRLGQLHSCTDYYTSGTIDCANC